MFTEQELGLILDALDDSLHDLTVELIRQKELGYDVTPLNEEREELKALTDKVRNLFLEA